MVVLQVKALIRIYRLINKFPWRMGNIGALEIRIGFWVA